MFDDVEFEPEGPQTESCGMDTRRCQQCSSLQDSDDPVDWCTTRTMVPRMAVRLRRLAKIVNIEKGLLKIEVLLIIWSSIERKLP